MTMQALLRPLLDRVRQRADAPEVQFTPPAVRGGNILYYWQWAHLRRGQGARASVLATEHMTAWLDEFPALRNLTVPASDVKLFDRRLFATRHHFGMTFTAEQNLEFSRWLLESAPGFQERLRSISTQIDDRTCVINVRRGDYYSVPEYRREFAIDIPAHVTQALTILAGAGRDTDDLLIISDDAQWCRQELAPLLPTAPRYLQDRRSMFDDLAALVSSRSLVLANSTFSYWGSFLARALHEDHLAIAPPYHQRVAGGGAMDDVFDPRWPRTEETRSPA